MVTDMARYTCCNVHIHTFTNNHLPSNMLYVPGLMRLLRKENNQHRLARFLRGLFPTDNDLLDRAANYIITGSHRSQRHVLESMIYNYPPDTAFAIHAMDFEQMSAGKIHAQHCYINQLNELRESFSILHLQRRLRSPGWRARTRQAGSRTRRATYFSPLPEKSKQKRAPPAPQTSDRAADAF